MQFDVQKRHKLSSIVGEVEQEHLHAKTFRRETIGNGRERIVAGLRSGDAELMRSLLDCLGEEFGLLYVLHTPRGEGDPGRYESAGLGREALAKFLSEFGEFLGNDARCDLWVHCFATGATLVWDRHNLLYAYGRLEEFQDGLQRGGFSVGHPFTPVPHVHHYHSENDAIAARVLKHLSWQRKPLRPEDEQFRAG